MNESLIICSLTEFECIGKVLLSDRIRSECILFTKRIIFSCLEFRYFLFCYFHNKTYFEQSFIRYQFFRYDKDSLMIFKVLTEALMPIFSIGEIFVFLEQVFKHLPPCD